MRPVKKYKEKILLTVLVLSLSVFIISATALSLAYKMPSHVQRSVNEKLLESEVHISLNYHIKPSILFDNKTEIKSKSIYMSLAQGVSYGVSIKTKYYDKTLHRRLTNRTISAIKTIEITTSSWRKTVIEEDIDLKNGTLVDRGYISFDKYTSFVRKINNQIGLHPVGYTIIIKYRLIYMVEQGYTYRAYNFVPTIIIDYDELNKIIKTRTDNTTLTVEKDNTVYIPGNTTIFGMKVNTAWLREKSFYSTIVSATIMLSSLGAIAYYMISNGDYYHEKILKKYRSRIFNGKFIHSNKEIVKVEDVRDIIRASELYGEIIIYDSDRNQLIVNARNNVVIYENSDLDKML